MKKSQHGFAVAETLLVVLVLVAIGGVGYYVYHRSHKANSVASQQAASNAPSGTTQSIDQLTAQDASNESGIDTQYGHSDQSAAQSSDGAASSIGGAYNESTL